MNYLKLTFKIIRMNNFDLKTEILTIFYVKLNNLDHFKHYY